ncbi:MAG: hypothetical protein AAFX87_06725 [Bacteroidota bacterium]
MRIQAYIFFFLTALFAGGTLKLLFDLQTNFYDEKAIDKLILLGIFSATFAFSIRFIKKQPPWIHTASAITMMIVLVFGPRSLYTLTGYTELAGLLVYLCMVLLGTAFGIFYRHYKSAKNDQFAFPILMGIGLWTGSEWIDLNTTNGVFILALIPVIFLLINVSKWHRILIAIIAVLVIGLSFLWDEPIKLYPTQKKYFDKLVFSHKTRFQQIDVTEWKGNYWFYLDNVNQFASLDEWLYAEPLIHPVMTAADEKSNVLIIGGENGLGLREVLKYDAVNKVHLAPVDREYLEVATTNELYSNINEQSLKSDRLTIIDQEIFRYLSEKQSYYDIIIIDVPDPIDIELNQYFTKELYELCFLSLKPKGLMVTQAGSPYFATKAFMSLEFTIGAAGFQTVPYHNQILSLGEWGWIVGAKTGNSDEWKEKMKGLNFEYVTTKWLNNESMRMMLSFGKPYIDFDSISINTLKRPVLHQYYSTGTWKF